MLRHTARLLLLGGLLFGACARSPEKSRFGSCDVDVTGAETMQLHGRPDARGKPVTTDYWQTKSELSRKFNEKEMKQDPIAFLLLLVCLDEPSGGLLLHDFHGAKYADVGFAPGRYRIGGKTDPFVATLTNQRTQARYQAEKGELQISAFDTLHIAGQLSFDGIEQAGKTVAVHGSFDFPCQGSACTRF